MSPGQTVPIQIRFLPLYYSRFESEMQDETEYFQQLL